MDKTKNLSIFRKFLISYILILFIPLITGFISYQVSIKIIKSSSVEASLMLLNQSKDILDRRMEEVEGFTKHLVMNQDLNYLLNDQKKNGSYNIYGLWKTLKNISTYSYTNNFLDDFYIYLKNYNVILTPSTTFMRPQDYYELYHYKDIDKNQWKEEILEKIHHREIIPLRPFIRNEKELSVITYVQSLPLDSFKRSKGTVVILIDERKVRKLFERISQQYGGWAYITDQEGRIIATMGIDESYIKALNLPRIKENHSSDPLLNDDTLLISTKSDYNGWLYVVGIPKNIVLKKAYFIEKITWTITLFTLLVGLFIALLFAYRNSAPINKLLGILREQVGHVAYKGKNPYDFIQGNISSLISNNKSMQEELTRQLPLLKDTFIKRLIKGEFDSLNEMKAAISQTGIQLHGEYGYVAIVRINGYSGLVSKDILNELNAVRLITKRILQEMSRENMNITDIESDKMAIVFTYACEPDSNARNNIEEIFTFLKESLETRYHISITVSIGSAFRNLQDASRSFEEAKQVLNFAVFMQDKSMLWYQNVPKETMTYYYPIDLELRLMNAVKIGEFSEVKRIISQIFEQNFTERQLSAETSLQLISEMKGTLFKLLEQNLFQDSRVSEHMKHHVESVHFSDSLEQVKKNMENLFEMFCDLVSKKKNENQNEIINQIIDFLDANYMDADLTLYRIAEAVGLSEKYISQLFKEQTGEYLSNYLEKIRIKKATDLLFNTELKIDEISRNVGYNSAHSFRRAFKRVSGVSPSIYRKTVN